MKSTLLKVILFQFEKRFSNTRRVKNSVSHRSIPAFLGTSNIGPSINSISLSLLKSMLYTKTLSTIIKPLQYPSIRLGVLRDYLARTFKGFPYYSAPHLLSDVKKRLLAPKEMKPIRKNTKCQYVNS